MSKSFIFEISGTHKLSVEEIWPNGDAPNDSPSTQDVISEVLKNVDSVRTLVREWNIEPTLLHINGFEVEELS